MVSDAHPDSPSLSPPGRGSPHSRDVSRRDKEEERTQQPETHINMEISLGWSRFGTCASASVLLTLHKMKQWWWKHRKQKEKAATRSNTLRQMRIKMQADHEIGEVASTGDITSLRSVTTARLTFPWNRGEWRDSGLGVVKRDTLMFALFMAAVPPETASANVLFSPCIIYKESPALNEH